MPQARTYYGPIDARLYCATIRSLRELGVDDVPLKALIEVSETLSTRLQKFTRDCAAYDDRMLQRIEGSLSSLLNISHLVQDTRSSLLIGILSPGIHRQLEQTLAAVVAHRSSLAALSDLPGTCSG